MAPPLARTIRNRSAPQSEALMLLGHVTRPHSLGGEARVLAVCSEAAVWEKALNVTLYLLNPTSNEKPRPVRLEAFRPHGTFILAKFEGVDDRDDAGALRGAGLWMDRADLPDLDEDAFYEGDLIGLDVVDQPSGDLLGRVEEVKDFGGQDCLLVRRPDDRTFLIPFTGAFIGEVNATARLLNVTLPPGLIDLNDRPAQNDSE